VSVATASQELVLGRYRPLRPLGSGGSGSVWLARDEVLEREVALKIVPRTGKAGSRAEREVEAATRLRHPRCLRALAFHRDEGHAFVAYEYVRGRTLREALRAGDVAGPAAVEIAAQVLDALAHAHAKGIAHRDVKPANVMLEDGLEVSTRLLDFGLARLEELEGLTATGDVPGTLAYIAPERLDGRESGGPADVWAVGVMLWEALVGRHPFSATSPVEVGRRIAAGAPPLARERPDLPRALCATVDDMLALDARRRPSAERAAAALRAAEDELLRRPRISPAERARERTVHAGLAALLAAGTTTLLPFFPRGWPILLGAVVGLVALRSASGGLALALAVPVLPLGNFSLGLALLYSAFAAAWLFLFRSRPRNGLLFAVGALLGPLGALPLVAIASLQERGAVRRGLLAAAGTLAAVAAAALVGDPLPLTRLPAGTTASLAGLAGPSDVGAVLLDSFIAHLVVGILVFSIGAAAVLAPHAAARGPWAITGWGAALLAAIVLLPQAAGIESMRPITAALGVWAAAAVLAVWRARTLVRDPQASGTMLEASR